MPHISKDDQELRNCVFTWNVNFFQFYSRQIAVGKAMTFALYKWSWKPENLVRVRFSHDTNNGWFIIDFKK